MGPDAHGKASFNWLEGKSKDKVVDSQVKKRKPLVAKKGEKANPICLDDFDDFSTYAPQTDDPPKKKISTRMSKSKPTGLFGFGIKPSVPPKKKVKPLAKQELGKVEKQKKMKRLKPVARK